METIISCNCGKDLKIISVECSTTHMYLTVEECIACADTNYEAGEADAKEHG